jgi:nitric oxide reductase NorQ protein
VALELNYPGPELETEIICHEAGVEEQLARFLVRIAAMTRGLKDSGLREGASTRLLVHAGLLIREGIARREACHVTISEVLTDDHELVGAIDEMISSVV